MNGGCCKRAATLDYSSDARPAQPKPRRQSTDTCEMPADSSLELQARHRRWWVSGSRRRLKGGRGNRATHTRPGSILWPPLTHPTNLTYLACQILQPPHPAKLTVNRHSSQRKLLSLPFPCRLDATVLVSSVGVHKQLPGQRLSIPYLSVL